MTSVVAFIGTVAITAAMQWVRWRVHRGEPNAWGSFVSSGGTWLGWPLLFIAGTYMLVFGVTAWIQA